MAGSIQYNAVHGSRRDNRLFEYRPTALSGPNVPGDQYLGRL